MIRDSMHAMSYIEKKAGESPVSTIVRTASSTPPGPPTQPSHHAPHSTVRGSRFEPKRTPDPTHSNMFAQIAQRLMPLRVQSNKMATTTAVAMTFCQSSRRMGASAMTSTLSSSSSPSSPPGSGTWRMGGSNILLSGGRISLLPSGRPYPSTPGAAYYYSVVPNYSSPGASSSTSCSTTTTPILASSYSSALPRLLLANAVGGNAPALHTRGFATKKVRVVGGGGG